MVRGSADRSTSASTPDFSGTSLLYFLTLSTTASSNREVRSCSVPMTICPVVPYVYMHHADSDPKVPRRTPSRRQGLSAGAHLFRLPDESASRRALRRDVHVSSFPRISCLRARTSDRSSLHKPLFGKHPHSDGLTAFLARLAFSASPQDRGVTAQFSDFHLSVNSRP